MEPELRDYRCAGWDVRVVERVGSTNDALLEAGRQGAAEGVVMVADVQTAGRGRLDRRWEAPPGSCLLMSLLFRPPEPFTASAPRVTMACGLALVDAIAEIAGLDVPLKWPNDLIVTRDGGWAKIAGMLSEIGSDVGAPPFLVVGIGLNVNVPAAHLPNLAPNATSLLVERGHPLSRVALLDAFLQRIATRYAGLRTGDDPLPEWRGRLVWMGQQVQVHTPTESVTGVAVTVNDTGALVLRLPDGSLRAFSVGDVSLRV